VRCILGIADAEYLQAWEQQCAIDEVQTKIREITALKAMTIAEIQYRDGRLKELVSELELLKRGAPAQTTAPIAMVDTKTDVTLMASRRQLIEAFGAFTGMDDSWFSNIKDTPALLAARKVTGQGGRGHIAEPLFCPFEVLQWLINPARRKGRPLGQDKGWELLARHFPGAYAAFSVVDPRVD